MKPKIWKFKNFCPGVVIAAMRRRAIRTMLRDMWCAAAVEVAREYNQKEKQCNES